MHVRPYLPIFEVLPSEAQVMAAAPLPFCVGHLPLSPAAFAAGQPPQLVCVQAVDEEELEGYRYWKEAGGGLF